METRWSQRISYHTGNSLEETSLLDFYPRSTCTYRRDHTCFLSSCGFTGLGNLWQPYRPAPVAPPDRDILGQVAGGIEPGRSGSGERISRQNTGDPLDQDSS